MKSFIGMNKLIFLCSIFFCACNQPQFMFDKSSLNRIVTQYVQNNSHPFITMRIENGKGIPIYNYTSINQTFLPNHIIDENSLMRRLSGLLYLDPKIVGDTKKIVINNLKK